MEPERLHRLEDNGMQHEKTCLGLAAISTGQAICINRLQMLYIEQISINLQIEWLRALVLLSFPQATLNTSEDMLLPNDTDLDSME
jgi:hypothetical protein